MANFFDQFDEEPSVAKEPEGGANFFDQFEEDEPTEATPQASPDQPEAQPEEADEPSWWRKVWYNADATESMQELGKLRSEQQYKTPTKTTEQVLEDGPTTTDVGGLLQKMGITTGVLSEKNTPEEEEAVRTRQQEEKDERLRKTYPELHGLEGSQEGSAAIVGSLAKAIVSPETLLPGSKLAGAAKTVRRGMTLAQQASAKSARRKYTAELAATGGALGGGYSILQQKVEDGEVDPIHAMQAAALASVAGPALAKVGGKVVAKATERKAKKQLSKLLGREQYYREVGGLSHHASSERAMNDLRVSVSKREELTDPLFTGVDTARKNAEFRKLTKRMHKSSTHELSPQRQTPFRNGVSDFMQASADSLGAINRKLGEKLRRSDAMEGIAEANNLTRAKIMVGGRANKAAMKQWGSLTKAEGRDLKLALRNGRPSDINAKLSNPKIGDELREVLNNWRVIRGTLRNEAQPHGLKIAELEGGEHFPQVHKSAGALRNSAKKAGLSDKKLAAVMRDATSERGEDVPAHILDQRVRDIAKLLKSEPGLKVSERTPGFTRQRNTQRHLNPEDMDDYLDPMDAISRYMKDYSKDLHRRKFWGMGDSVAESVPKIVEEEAANGMFLPGEAGRVKDFLLTRFTTAEVPPSKFVRDTKNFTNLVLLGNPKSALTQLGDIGVSRYFNGTLNTLKALFGPKWVNSSDVGVVSVAQELSDMSNFSGKALDKMLGVSGFRRVDRLGKDVAINASVRKYHKWANTEAGRRRIVDQYERTFNPDELTRVINTFSQTPSRELLANDDLARTVLVHDLLQMQPVALSELPLWYQKHPNGRLLFSLKTFALKQMNLVHKTIWKEWQTGDKKRAIINAARYGTIMSTMTGLTGFAKGALSGKFKDEKDLNYQQHVLEPGVWGMLSGFLGPLGNKYNIQQIGEERDALRQIVSETVLPPAISIIDSLVWSLTHNRPESAVRYIPYAGPLLTDWID